MMDIGIPGFKGEERPPTTSGQVGKAVHRGLLGTHDELASFDISGVIDNCLTRVK